MARAEMVAVTGPNGIPVSAIIPNVHKTTSATGRIVITPRNGLRDSMRKLRTSRRPAASNVMRSELSCDSDRDVTTTSPMMFSFVATAVTSSKSDSGSRSTARSAASSFTNSSPACVDIDMST